MPRASASAKRQHGASNQRDTRHENGLVGPGKRIPKQQKSQNQLNGNSTPNKQQQQQPAVDDAAVPPVPSTPPPTTNGYCKSPTEMPAEHKTTDSLRRASLGTYSESSSSESYNSHLGNTSPEDNHRRIDVNATKNSNVHRDTGILDFTLTVLRSCPLQDTIAILIILMQIPPLALSGIYVLFTLLTFVTSNGLNLSDVFEWNLGAPSLATVICVDAIVLLIWLFLWGPIQHVILDLAQMVIALGLGGGSSSRDGGSMKNTLICLSMILLSHVLRHTKMKYSPVGYLMGSSRFMVPDFDDPLEALDSIRGYDKVQAGWFGWVKSILAIHILTQGLVKYIRDWYLRRERRDNLALTAADPEAGKSYAADNDGGFSTPDSDAVQTSTALTTKKKRKHSAQVRNRQPLWAALASTKVVVVKEYELTHATAESAGSNATDIHNLGNAPFNTQPGQIWISYVGCDEVCFNTSEFPVQPAPESQSDGSRVDLSKPFYVRVNNAIWQPTRMTPVENTEEDCRQGVRWSGDIYGLTPMSNYECEFVCTATHEILFSTSVRTTQAKTADVDASSSKPNSQRSLRPDSPFTTLKTSIAAAESKLAEEKSRQKALRKEFHRKTNAMKKENEKLSAAVQSAGTGDDKLRQKIQQNTTQQKQAEHATSSLEAELKEFEKIPESLKSSWKSKQSAWTNEKAKYDGAVAAFKSFKASVDGGIKALEEEKASLQAKRNKISSRISKVDGEHARIADANARGLDEAERRRQARENYEKEMARMERDLIARITEIEAAIHTKDSENLSLKMQLDSFHTQQQAAYAYATAYDFPEAAGQFTSPGAGPHAQPSVSNPAPYDATAAWSNSLYNNSLWAAPGLASAFAPQSTGMSHPPRPAAKARNRSSSMLSDVSHFTESSKAEEEWNKSTPAATYTPGVPRFSGLPPPGFGYRDGVAVSDGSCSLSGGSVSSGSSRDPMSPPPS
ncbi:Uu.00g095220.m01.CDS01 [Anthostomella pinea]|uniref:Uu.00g095220.m01.CDS01 n=1 Tax=Anthostomella pinea TaxID=933095 RepID=A0AAI8VT27_9PEZI|nr:Uu.00g095220.m01.CDS01 [Anthostomella pinea]